MRLRPRSAKVRRRVLALSNFRCDHDDVQRLGVRRVNVQLRQSALQHHLRGVSDSNDHHL